MGGWAAGEWAGGGARRRAAHTRERGAHFERERVLGKVVATRELLRQLARALTRSPRHRTGAQTGE
jgi:hypothetical protein